MSLFEWKVQYFKKLEKILRKNYWSKITKHLHFVTHPLWAYVSCIFCNYALHEVIDSDVNLALTSPASTDRHVSNCIRLEVECFEHQHQPDCTVLGFQLFRMFMTVLSFFSMATFISLKRRALNYFKWHHVLHNARGLKWGLTFGWINSLSLKACCSVCVAVYEDDNKVRGASLNFVPARQLS